jgi:hypothetical protein
MSLSIINIQHKKIVIMLSAAFFEFFVIMLNVVMVSVVAPMEMT